MKNWKWLVVLLVCTVAGCASQGMGPSTEATPANEEITNNQEEGVDEGGIVKNIGDYLVVLRKGELYSVNVAESGRMRQGDAVRVAAHEDLDQNVWYDEMLVRGRDIYVVGFRYGARIKDAGYHWWSGWQTTGATEIDHFVLRDDGQLERKEVVFFESNDYYDTSNYASRMIGDQVVFYIPLFARDGDQVPHLLEWTGGRDFRRVAPLFEPDDVMRFGDEPRSDIRHTVVSCSVAEEQLSDCSARAMDGGWWTTRYVTADDVFLWADEKVIAFSLRDGTISGHRVRGHALNQFSFKWDGEDLRVLARDGNRLELFELPREAFDDRAEQGLDDVVRTLEAGTGSYHYLYQNRFVGDDWLLTASRGDRQRAQVTAYNLSNGAIRELGLANAWVSRLEPLPGVGALVAANVNVGSQYGHSGLQLIALKLDDDAMVGSTLNLDSAGEGESRSHAFFFKPDSVEGGGKFGLPVVARSGNHGWWGKSVSNIAFFDVTSEGELALLGAVSASDEDGSSCEASCIDWYGNTRPIFLRDRIYALMGSEIVEVNLASGEPGIVQRLILRG